MTDNATPCHQTGLIITKQDNGAYAYTLTSHGVDHDADQLVELFRVLGLFAPPSIQEIDRAIAESGQAVVGSPTRLNEEEQAACVC